MASEKIVTESALAALASDAKRAIYDVLPGGSASGNPCTFDTDIAVPLKSLIANIVASGGNGTPSTPIPIVGHSELNLVRCGKNLYPIKISNDIFADNASATHTASGDELVINATSSGNSGAYSANVSDISKLIGKLSGTVTYSFDISVTVAGWYLVGITNVGREAKNLSTGWQRITLTGTANRTINTLVFYNQTNTASEIRVKNFILESGSTAHDYEPYNGQTFTVQFGQTVYGGVYANRGKVRITWGSTDLGSLNWIYESGTPRFYTLDTASYVKPATSPNVAGNILCSIYETKALNDIYISVDNVICVSTSGNVSVKDTRFTDALSFKTAMSGILLVYELATPIEIDVSELSVNAIVGTNNIVSDCGGDVAVEYRESVEKYVTEHGGGASWTDVVGTLTAGSTSITLSNAAITTTSTIQVFTDPEIPYNTLTVSNGSATLTFDAQANNVSVKVRVT